MGLNDWPSLALGLKFPLLSSLVFSLLLHNLRMESRHLSSCVMFVDVQVSKSLMICIRNSDLSGVDVHNVTRW